MSAPASRPFPVAPVAPAPILRGRAALLVFGAGLLGLMLLAWLPLGLHAAGLPVRRGHPSHGWRGINARLHRGLFAVLGGMAGSRVVWRGLEHLDGDSPKIIAAGHTSMLDVPALAAATGAAPIIVKASKPGRLALLVEALWLWPAVRLSGGILIPRVDGPGRQAPALVRAVKRATARGLPVIIFPQGSIAGPPAADRKPRWGFRRRRRPRQGQVIEEPGQHLRYRTGVRLAARAAGAAHATGAARAAGAPVVPVATSLATLAPGAQPAAAARGVTAVVRFLAPLSAPDPQATLAPQSSQDPQATLAPLSASGPAKDDFLARLESVIREATADLMAGATANPQEKAR